ncbi:hypothetical protein EST38_g7445 [Candolleomyces aberdarensis]|uniref:DUF159-domain-containing protein n=1 Tax=Candolleomyces aberdarensis TaxID=2316362 RepID=A0A4Q2DFL2_9AGAR|nr:hypothetical protein EST38_g7445 [Candolleomyces aberdarensis]
MCGRFALRANNRREIRELRGNNANVDEWEGEDDFVPRYNIAPRTQAPVVRRRDPGPSRGQARDDGEPSLIMQTMKWGLVPNWSKVEDNTLNTINARAENLAEGGGMWGSIKGKKRYYEWLTKGKDKLPHFTKRKDGSLLLMAGLYDSAVIDGRTLWTFTIVTTDANKEFSWLHDRQPVFLTDKAALDKWLDTSSQTWTKELSDMVLQPYHDASVPLECYQVPKEVGKIGNESPTFIEPVATRKDGIQAMFAKQKQKATESSSLSHSQDSSHDLESSTQELKLSSQQYESSSSSPAKGKRARSPIPIDLSQDDAEEIQVVSEPKAKKPKAAPNSPPPLNKMPKVDTAISGFLPKSLIVLAVSQST